MSKKFKNLSNRVQIPVPPSLSTSLNNTRITQLVGSLQPDIQQKLSSFTSLEYDWVTYLVNRQFDACLKGRIVLTPSELLQSLQDSIIIIDAARNGKPDFLLDFLPLHT